MRACSGDEGGESEVERTTKTTAERRSFLTLEEAGLVEVSGLSTHERFLCRLTVRDILQTHLPFIAVQRKLGFLSDR